MCIIDVGISEFQCGSTLQFTGPYNRFHTCLPNLYFRTVNREGDSHLFTLNALYADIDAVPTSTGGLGGWVCKGRDMT